MFTGIIEKTQRVIGTADGPKFRRLTLVCDWADVAVGQSLAINGACLTIAQLDPGEMGFDVVKETLAKTNLGRLQNGDLVNIERALRPSDRLDGHFVQGHIDSTARLLRAIHSKEESRLMIHTPAHLAAYIIPKGSIAIDGVSLTVAAVHDDHFEVALIPTTLKLTTLGSRTEGYEFNIETDMLCKTIVAWLERQKA